MAKVEISYLDLAKEAHSRGDRNGVLRAIANHKRVKRKERLLLEQKNARLETYPSLILHQSRR